MTTTDQTSRQTILDALSAAGVSPEDAAKMIKDAAKTSTRANTQSAQQLAADKLSKFTDKELTAAGVSRDDYIAGVRTLLGGTSHNITIPDPFGPRYASDGVTTLWGRPRPVKKSDSNGDDTTDDSETV